MLRQEETRKPLPFISELAQEIKKEDVFIIGPPTQYKDFRKESFEPIPYLADKLIEKQALNLVVGYSQAGKTFVTIELAVQIASGGRVFGVYQCEPAPVLIINEEDTRRGMNEKIRTMSNQDDLPIYFHVQSGIKLDNPKTIDQVVEQVQSLHIGLVVFDNLTQLHTLNESASDQMQKLIDQLKRITAAGAAVILVHHNRKDNGMAGNRDNGAAIRGSGSLFNAVNTCIELSRSKDPNNFIIEIEQTKNKDDERIKGSIKIQLHHDEERTWFEFIGMQSKEVSAAFKLQNDICSLIRGKDNMKDMKQIEAAVGKSDTVASQAIAELLRLGRVKRATYAQLGIKVGRGAGAYLYWTEDNEDPQQTIILEEDSIPF